MTEEQLFEFFKKTQLAKVDFSTGQIDTKVPKQNQHKSSIGEAIVKDVGSLNEDGYVRIWCGKANHPEYPRKLKMRHRLVYYLYHGAIPKGKEIDHIDRNRANDSITILRAVTRKENTKNSVRTTKRGTYTEAQILEVCEFLQNTTLSDVAIAKKTELSRNYVRDIKKRRRKQKTSINYSWSHRE